GCCATGVAPAGGTSVLFIRASLDSIKSTSPFPSLSCAVKRRNSSLPERRLLLQRCNERPEQKDHELCPAISRLPKRGVRLCISFLFTPSQTTCGVGKSGRTARLSAAAPLRPGPL